MPEIRWVVWMLAVMWWVKYFVNLCETASWVETSYVVALIGVSWKINPYPVELGIGVILYVWFLFEMRNQQLTHRLHTENLPPTEP